MLKAIKRSSLVLMLAMPACGWASGFYVGAGVGMDTATYQQNSYGVIPGDLDFTNKTELGAQGQFGTLFAGYGLRYRQFCLSGEVNGNASNANSHSSNLEKVHNTLSKTTYRINRSWGVSLLPGMLLPYSTLVYGRVGFAQGHYEVDTTDSSLQNGSKNLNGVRYGLGIEKQLWRNLGLRLEYSHINYQNSSQFTLDTGSSFTKRTIVTPNVNQFELGVTYRFC